MAPKYTKALESFQTMGRMFQSDDLQGLWRGDTEEPLIYNCDRDMIPIEKPVPAGLSSAELWSRLQAGNVNEMYHALEKIYGIYVKLRGFFYRGRLQIQIEVTNDEVFYSFNMWKVMKNWKLYRGMVVEMGDRPAQPSNLELSTFQIKILETVKIKCLAYLMRTFGFRNIIQVAAKKKSDGMNNYKRLVEIFFRNWSVPEQYRGPVREALLEVAARYLALSPSVQESVDANYLSLFEPFFDSGEEASTKAAREMFGLPSASNQWQSSSSSSSLSSSSSSTYSSSSAAAANVSSTLVKIDVPLYIANFSGQPCDARREWGISCRELTVKQAPPVESFSDPSTVVITLAPPAPSAQYSQTSFENDIGCTKMFEKTLLW